MRARNLKPGFFNNPVLLSMPATTRILFLGLAALCDRRGLLIDRPLWIKRHVLPGDQVDVNAALSELATSADDDGSTMITRYVDSNGTPSIKINKFLRHNSPHYKEEINPEILDIGEKPGASPRQAQGFVSMVEEKPGASPRLAPGKPPTVGALPPLNPESGILNPESGILNPESCALAQSDARARGGQPDPGPDPDPVDVASEIRRLAGGCAMDRPKPPDSPAHAAARSLVAYRSKLDPAPINDLVVEQWALALARLHAGGRPWDEIHGAMDWVFAADTWWPQRILTAHDFAKHYARIRGQWQASIAEPAAPAAEAPAITREMVANLDWLVAEGEDVEAWIATQPQPLRQRLGAMLASRLAAQDGQAAFHVEQPGGNRCPTQ